MSKWEKLVNGPRSLSKEEVGQGLSPDSAHNRCPTAFYTPGKQARRWKQEHRAWSAQEAGPHPRVCVCSFQVLGPGVFCINCSSRTLFFLVTSFPNQGRCVGEHLISSWSHDSRMWTELVKLNIFWCVVEILAWWPRTLAREHAVPQRTSVGLLPCCWQTHRSQQKTVTLFCCCYIQV